MLHVTGDGKPAAAVAGYAAASQAPIFLSWFVLLRRCFVPQAHESSPRNLLLGYERLALKLMRSNRFNQYGKPTKGTDTISDTTKEIA